MANNEQSLTNDFGVYYVVQIFEVQILVKIANAAVHFVLKGIFESRKVLHFSSSFHPTL